MRTVTAKPNMSVKDLVLTGCGSMESAMVFCQDNNMSRTAIPVPGRAYIVSDAALAVAGKDGTVVLKYLQRNRVTIGTLGPVDVAGTSEPLLNEDGTPLENEDGSTLMSE